MAFLGRMDITGNVRRVNNPSVVIVEQTEALEDRKGWNRVVFKLFSRTLVSAEKQV